MIFTTCVSLVYWYVKHRKHRKLQQYVLYRREGATLQDMQMVESQRTISDDGEEEQSQTDCEMIGRL